RATLRDRASRARAPSLRARLARLRPRERCSCACLFCVERQRELEARRFVLALIGQRTTVRRCDRAREREAEPRAFGLRREERLEELVRAAFGDARAAIEDDDLRALAAVRYVHVDDVVGLGSFDGVANQ